LVRRPQTAAKAVTNRDANQFAVGITLTKLRSVPHDLGELLHHLALFVHEQLGVTDHIQEQNVRRPEMELRLYF